MKNSTIVDEHKNLFLTNKHENTEDFLKYLDSKFIPEVDLRVEENSLFSKDHESTKEEELKSREESLLLKETISEICKNFKSTSLMEIYC